MNLARWCALAAPFAGGTSVLPREQRARERGARFAGWFEKQVGYHKRAGTRLAKSNDRMDFFRSSNVKKQNRASNRGRGLVDLPDGGRQAVEDVGEWLAHHQGLSGALDLPRDFAVVAR